MDIFLIYVDMFRSNFNIITARGVSKKIMTCTQNALDEVINSIPIFFVCVQNW